MDNNTTDKLRDLNLVIIARACGGWLATTPKEHRFRIGVTADTKEEAELKLLQTIERWTETANEITL